MGFALLLHKDLPSFQVPRGLKRPRRYYPSICEEPVLTKRL
jgi:hypothetical protein